MTRQRMTPAAHARWQVQAPILFLTATAWLMLAVRPGGTALVGSCCPPVSLESTFSADSLQQAFTRNPPALLVAGWLLMLAAMMTPLLAAPVRYVLDRSFARRRVRAVALFLAGYLVLWMAAGAGIVAVALGVRLYALTSFLPLVVVAGLVCLWQCSPLKQCCLNHAHAHPALAAFGPAADRDALRFGLMHGAWCVGSCWGLMLLPEVLSSGHLIAMAAVTLWLWAEQIERPRPPRWHLGGTGKAVRLVMAQARTVLPHQ